MTAREPDRPLQLLEIARRLFAEQGFAGTSLRDIATEAGVTKAALYHHFPNKDALYEKVVVDGMRTLLDTVEAAVDAAASPLDRVRAFMIASADYFDRRRFEWLASSTAFWQGDDASPRASAIAYRDAYEALLRRCVVEGIAAGEIRADVEPALAAKLLLSSLNQMPRWYRPGGPLAATQIIERFLQMTLDGLACPRTVDGHAADAHAPDAPPDVLPEAPPDAPPDRRPLLSRPPG